MAYSVRVKEVEALDDFVLSVLFVNGVKKYYDAKPLFLEFPQMFAPMLENPALFQEASVDCGGCGVSWNADMDVSECELWENGTVALDDVKNGRNLSQPFET